MIMTATSKTVRTSKHALAIARACSYQWAFRVASSNLSGVMPVAVAMMEIAVATSAAGVAAGASQSVFAADLSATTRVPITYVTKRIAAIVAAQMRACMLSVECNAASRKMPEYVMC